jgi:hypothetical protein
MGNIPQVRTWRATFYGFGNLKLGSVTVLAPTKLLARLGLFDAIMGSDKGTREAWEKCSRITWGIVRKPETQADNRWPKLEPAGVRKAMRMVKT